MLPDLVIIGAMKCGTTSLHHYLSLHPEISMSKQKELDFFLGKKNWKKGVDWYQSQFKGKAKVFGESSPNYTIYSKFPGVPERMYRLIPQAKLIYLVRDPIERMIAHYIHQYSGGFEHRGIDEALINPGKNSYFERSLYYTQLCYYLDYYKAAQILVIPAEELRNDTRKTLSKIFDFLEVDPSYQSWQYAIQRHRSVRKRRKTLLGEKISTSPTAKILKKIPQRLRWPLEDILYFPFSKSIHPPVLNEQVRQKLEFLLKEDTEKLRNYTGSKFAYWKI
jgi:hypothetical protein